MPSRFWSTRCVDGRLMRHDPQPDDPSLETDYGPCPDCDGKGCRRCESCGGPLVDCECEPCTRDREEGEAFVARRGLPWTVAALLAVAITLSSCQSCWYGRPVHVQQTGELLCLDP